MNDHSLASLGSRADFLVVGGGVYGASIALELAFRGCDVALVERADFGGGTSGQSLRIMHGGLRYLQHADLPRMRESIAARSDWLRDFPTLVEPLRCALPTYGHGIRGPEALRTALALNDVISFDRNRELPPTHHLPRGRVLSKRDATDLYERFRVSGHNGAAIWYDAAAANTERMLVGILAAAERCGARVRNYTALEELRVRDDRVQSAVLRDAIDGTTLEIAVGHVVNAAGPWAGDVLGSVSVRDIPAPGVFSLAINLILDGIDLPQAIGVPVPRRGRENDALIQKGANSYFLMPWNGLTLAGTHHVSRDWRDVSPGELDRIAREFLTHCRTLLPEQARAPELLGVLAGGLPEAGALRASEDPVLAKHPWIVDHAQRDGVGGLTTVVGVKWTTARAVARRVADEHLSRHAATPSAGGATPVGTMHEAFLAWAEQAGDARSQLEQQRPELGRPILPDHPVTGANLAYSARHEWTRRLSDVLQRRTDLWRSRAIDERALRDCAALVGNELGWSADRVEQEMDHARRVLDARRGPSSLTETT